LLASYASSLKVLTAYKDIEGIDVTITSSWFTAVPEEPVEVQ